jgi:Tol biopolymer transport system component
MQIMTRSPRRCSPLFRLILGVLLTASLIGCSGGVALKPMWTPCPMMEIHGISWSPNAEKIAYFIGVPYSGTTTLHITDLVSGGSNSLGELLTSSNIAKWSPDGSRMFVGYDRGTLESNLFFIDLNGTRDVLSQRSQGTQDYEWSPDGQYIAVLFQYPGTPSDLIVFSNKGESIWRLSETNQSLELVSDLDWSPDGSQMAFGVGPSNGGGIGIVSLSNSNIILIPSPKPYVTSLEWSPDGEWIAFKAVASSLDQDTMNLVKPDGTDLRQWTAEYAGYWQWLPDSSGIIYIDENSEVVSLSLDGTSPSILSSAPKGNYAYGQFVAGQFSPDATMFAYLFQGQYGEDDLYVMNVDGTNMQQLTDNPGNHKCFQWPF